MQLACHFVFYMKVAFEQKHVLKLLSSHKTSGSDKVFHCRYSDALCYGIIQWWLDVGQPPTRCSCQIPQNVIVKLSNKFL